MTPSFSATALLLALILALERTNGFSILPGARIKSISSWELSLSAKPAEQKTQSTPIGSSNNDDEEDDMQNLLSTLEKRVQQGPGSLTSSEVLDAATGSDRLLEQIELQHQLAPLNQESPEELKEAVSQMDAVRVTKLLEEGHQLDEATTEAAFWAIVKEVDRAEQDDEPLSGNVPIMLHHVFDADLRHLLGREQIRTNVTCMQPKEDGVEGKARSMNYIFDDAAHKDLPLTEGRRCEDGQCCDACSRNIFPTFASNAETDLETFPEIASLTFNDLKSVSSASILQFVRLIERVRRTMAHEYGLPLGTILPLQAYSRKYVAGTTQQGGGGGEGDFVTLHTDEATHSGYHYSCVLYLSDYGKDFEGGAFVFNDPMDTNEDKEGASDGSTEEGEDVSAASNKQLSAEEVTAMLEEFEKDSSNEDLIFAGPTGDEDDDDDTYYDEMTLAEEIRKAGRKLTPFYPTRGAAVIFSSGWENMHEVEKITSGIRYAVPCFFTTCPVPEAAYQQMKVGKPQSNEDIADDWLHLLLAHRRETPMEAVGRVKELLMKWHYMCTPLSQH